MKKKNTKKMWAIRDSIRNRFISYFGKHYDSAFIVFANEKYSIVEALNNMDRFINLLETSVEFELQQVSKKLDLHRYYDHQKIFGSIITNFGDLNVYFNSLKKLEQKLYKVRLERQRPLASSPKKKVVKI